MEDRPISNVFATPNTAIHTPLPADDADALILQPPRASHLFSDSSRSSYAPYTPTHSNNDSGALLPPADKREPDPFAEERNQPTKTNRKPLIFALVLAIIAVVVLAVILPVYFTVIKPKQRNTVASTTPSTGTNGGGSGGSSGGGGNPGNVRLTSGGDGSTVTMKDGSTFTYSNKFGGFWVDDPNDPFNNNAQPNSWTPPLNQSWRWGQDQMFGVNLGGLFVLEPFISPALFQRYPTAVDEWTLSTQMAADTANGGLGQLETHYKTFITEQDIAEIAGAGLNWIRLPIPFWAIETWPGEPFLAKTSWKYIEEILRLARKYGLRVLLDLHTVPGSANGYNHGGKLGAFNFLNGVMGIANAQRTLGYIRVITEFISQPQFTNVVPMFGIVNEALITTIGRNALTSFYLEAHTMIRSITGYGAGHGPFIVIHDGFTGLQSWTGFLPQSDRIALDTHPYFAFDGSPATTPIDTGTGPNAGGTWPQAACQRWAQGTNASQVGFGVTMAGEFSTGFNDCGLFLRGVPGSHTYGGNCGLWQDSTNWTAGTKAGLMNLALAQMDALQNWFFWTWKVGNSSAGVVESPLWSYQLGLENGWIPRDPRAANGMCSSLGVTGTPFDGTYQPWMIGGAGAGSIDPTATVQFPWLPSSINAVASVSLLPTYTSTGSVPTLPPPSLTPTPTKSVNVGNGWFDQQDIASAATPIAGCQYPNAWDAISAAVPPLCGAATGSAVSTITPPPSLATTTS